MSWRTVRIVVALIVTSAIIVLVLVEIHGGFDKILSKKDMLVAIKEELRTPTLKVQDVDILFERPRLRVTLEGQISHEEQDYLFEAKAEGEIVYNRDEGVFYIKSAPENIEFSKFEPPSTGKASGGDKDSFLERFKQRAWEVIKGNAQDLVRKHLSTIPIYRLGHGVVDDVAKQMLSEKAVEVGPANVIIHHSVYRPVKAFASWAFGSVWGLIVIAAVVTAIVMGVVIAFRILGKIMG